MSTTTAAGAARRLSTKTKSPAEAGLEFQCAATQAMPPVRTVQPGIWNREPLRLKPSKRLGHRETDLSLPSARIGWLAGHVVPKFVFEVARVVAAVEVRPIADEKEQLGGQLLRLQGEHTSGSGMV
jgi:hypothetical protein